MIVAFGITPSSASIKRGYFGKKARISDNLSSYSDDCVEISTVYDGPTRWKLLEVALEVVVGVLGGMDGY